MITPTSEAAFWNEAEMVNYFASKAADPRVVDRIDALGSDAAAVGLDIGCGGGRHTELLADTGFLTTSIDVNPAMIDATTRRIKDMAERTTVGFGSITNIPVNDDTFGLIISTGVLHQVRSAEAMNIAMGEISRVAQKGAVFTGNLFVCDVWDNTYSIPDSTRPEYVETREHVGMTLLDADRVIALFEQNGFHFEVDPVLDFKQENTGPRGVLRFCVELGK